MKIRTLFFVCYVPFVLFVALLTCFFVADLEAAIGAAFTIAVFVDRCFDYFRDERFGKAAHFRMNRY